MFWFILSINITIAAAYVLGLDPEEVGKNCYGDPIIKWYWSVRLRQLFAAFGLIFMLLGCIVKIPANSVGIVYSPFKGTSDQTLSEGIHTKNVFDKVYKFTTEVQSMTVEDLTTQTKDAQFVTTALDIKYRVSEANAYLIFKQFKTLNTLSKSFIIPTTQRILEHVTTTYNVIDILGEKRNGVYSDLEASLASEFAKYGIEFYSISITDMDAGEALENAIAEEAIAKKAVETAEQNLLKAQKEAQMKSVQAQAEQDAAKIEAETKLIEAEADKKANELLNQSLTDSILQKHFIDKWNGEMPKYYSGNESAMGIMLGITE